MAVRVPRAMEAPARPSGSTRPSRRLATFAGARTVEVTMSLTFPFDCTDLVEVIPGIAAQ